MNRIQSDKSKVSPKLLGKLISEDYSLTLCSEECINSISVFKSHEQS